MTTSDTSQPHTDFYLQVEDFVLNACIESTTNDALSNEIRLFLLTLLNHHKQQDQQ
ncbi:hypothetical protein [Vibrio sp. 99-8-1]|uniref:hypothetical protein n=1 Tax=Vibrio sp. 99-8-1 TaxID=2607602 RepID=UPI001493A54D|nr:hypothetical protein [Vibrio sp. 99-8-1]